MEQIQERIRQLQAEQQQVAAQLQETMAQAEQARHLLSAYSGAIGELQRLVQMPAEGSEEAQE